jgi:hypothetical protein
MKQEKRRGMGLVAQQRTQASMRKMRNRSKEERPTRHTLHVDIGTDNQIEKLSVRM